MADPSDLTFLRVWEEDDCSIIDPAHLGSIDAAVTQWRHEDRDNVLSLTTVAGGMYWVVASRITAWFLSTPETRRREVELEAALKDEEKANRLAFGLDGWED